MKRSRLTRKTPLRSKKGLKRTSRLSRNTRLGHNPERREKRYERDFGDKADWIREECRCVVCGAPNPDPHHEPPRSRGGTKEDQVGLCRDHHTEDAHSRHQLGSAERFREIHGVDLEQAAKDLDERWKQKQSSD